MLRLIGIVSFLSLLLLKILVLLHANELSDLERFYYLDNSVVDLMRNDEDFYHFFNRLTHGMIFNISMFNHKLLKKKGHHWPPYEIPKFNCSTKPPNGFKKAKTVHELTPFDIELIGGLGDSITAAFGALSFTLIDLFIEFRGISWSVGGDKDLDTHVTLPNILKKYNPNLKGYSTGIVPPLIPLPNIHLNKAVSGATSYGLLGQAEKYVEDLFLNPQYDFFGSWKMLTIFIGGNDLCSSCRAEYRAEYSPQNFTKEVEKALDYLHERVPKLFVNLVTSPDVTAIHKLASLVCDVTHFIECKCGSVYGKKARNFTRFNNKMYHNLSHQLIDSGRYDTREDFTVVIQPFLDKTDIPRLPDGSVDRSYFAPDCFHFSGKAHSAAAIGLWNNMLEPVGKKSREWKDSDPFKCPDAKFPYFFTSQNSKKL